MSALSFDYKYIDTIYGSRRFLIQMTAPDTEPAAQRFHSPNLPEISEDAAIERMKPDILWAYRRTYPEADDVVFTENTELVEE